MTVTDTSVRVTILPRTRTGPRAHPVCPNRLPRFPVVFSPVPVAPARLCDPTAMFGAHRAPAKPRAAVPPALDHWPDEDDTVVWTPPWALER